jgi:hypothetical protein
MHHGGKGGSPLQGPHPEMRRRAGRFHHHPHARPPPPPLSSAALVTVLSQVGMPSSSVSQCLETLMQKESAGLQPFCAARLSHFEHTLRVAAAAMEKSTRTGPVAVAPADAGSWGLYSPPPHRDGRTDEWDEDEWDEDEWDEDEWDEDEHHRHHKDCHSPIGGLIVLGLIIFACVRCVVCIRRRHRARRWGPPPSPPHRHPHPYPQQAPQQAPPHAQYPFATPAPPTFSQTPSTASAPVGSAPRFAPAAASDAPATREAMYPALQQEQRQERSGFLSSFGWGRGDTRGDYGRVATAENR